MNKNDFIEAASRERINPRYYSLDGGLVDNTYCIDSVPVGGWVVYFSERGSRWEERVFDSESDALTYMLARLIAEPHSRLPVLDE